jgi:hypothetical protein
LAELARHAPGPVDAVAELVDEAIDHVGIVDASVVGAVDGPELVGIVALRSEKGADVFDAAGEFQIAVETICEPGMFESRK